MPYLMLADLVLMLHAMFVLFVLFGAWLAVRWPPIVWLHLPAAAWGAAVEFGGWVCPLTPLEQWLRTQGSDPTSSGDFLARYLSPILYPAGLPREVQYLFGAIVLLANLIAYAVLWRRRVH